MKIKRNFGFHSLFLVGTFITTNTAVCANPISKPNTQAASSGNEQPFVMNQGCGSMTRIDPALQRWCETYLQQAFDPRTLSSSATKVAIDVTLSQHGFPTCKVINCYACSPTDRFYSEQSIWESSPVVFPSWAHDSKDVYLVGVYSNESSGTAWSESLAASAEKVRLHLIPVSILKYVDSIKVDSKANIVYLKIDRLEDRRLNDFRHEWTRFIDSNQPLTEVKVIEQARKMKLKYAALFTS